MSHHVTCPRTIGMSGVPIAQAEALYKKKTPVASKANLCAVIGDRILGTTEVDLALAEESLKTSGKRLHWAVNSYVRALAQRLPSSSLPSSSSASASGEMSHYITASYECMKPSEWDLVLDFLDAVNLLSLHLTSKRGLMDFTCDADRLWRTLLVRDRFLRTSTLRTAPGHVLLYRGLGIEDSYEGQASAPLYVGISTDLEDCSPRECYNLCRDFERRRCCFSCRSVESVVPCVYGFPSASIVSRCVKGSLIAGGDYLLEGAAAWACRVCSFEYLAYPYRIGMLEVEAKKEASK